MTDKDAQFLAFIATQSVLNETVQQLVRTLEHHVTQTKRIADNLNEVRQILEERMVLKI